MRSAGLGSPREPEGPSHSSRVGARSVTARLLPWGLTALLCLATFAVWRLQVAHQHRLVERHAEDVGGQAARRLETFVDAQLSTAGVLARLWSQRGTDGAGQQLWFEQLALSLLAEFPGYHGLAIVDRSGYPLFLAAEADSSIGVLFSGEGDSLLRLADRGDTGVVSDPFPVAAGKVSLFAAWPAGTGSYLIAEYRVDELIDDCFHGQIRAEFNYALEDEGETLFRFAAAANPPVGNAPARSVHSFAVRNRQWRLTVAQRAETNQHGGWRPDWSVAILGVLLSVGVGLLVALLQERIERYRVSEARYRGVFSAATDGILVLEEDGSVLDANPASCRLLGRELDELYGCDLRSLLVHGGQDLMRMLAECREAGRTLSVEAVLGDETERAVEVEVHGSSFIHQGRPAILTILTDITERRAAARRQEALAQRALVAQEEERTRVARDLHDDLGQLLTGLRLELDFMRRRHPERASGLESTDALVAKAVESVRRICRGLRPPLLADLGVESSVRQLVGEFAARSSVRVQLEVELDEEARPLPAEIGISVYRVLQEALTNISRHSRASEARVDLVVAADELLLRVEDNGTGLDNVTGAKGPGLGISGMQERVRLVSGTMQISSVAGVGTTIDARFPIPPIAARGIT
jgi:PAS domain S-box-containing protein